MEERMIAHRLLAKIFYRPYRDLIWRFPQEENNICLTFDDGPYPPVTKKALGILKEQKVSATFFLSGEKIFTHRHELKNLNYQGHTIGSHSFHHIPHFGLNGKKLFHEMKLTDQLIEEHLKQSPQLFRPPYGIFSPTLLRMLQEQNKKMVLWSLMANDFKWRAEKVLSHLTKSVRGGDVVVFHDSEKTERVVLEALREFIKYSRERGLRISDLGLRIAAS